MSSYVVGLIVEWLFDKLEGVAGIWEFVFWVFKGLEEVGVIWVFFREWLGDAKKVLLMVVGNLFLFLIRKIR